MCLYLQFHQKVHLLLVAGLLRSVDVVEMLTNINDWEEENARSQQTNENKELEEALSELYLDEGPLETPPSS